MNDTNHVKSLNSPSGERMSNAHRVFGQCMDELSDFTTHGGVLHCAKIHVNKVILSRNKPQR